MARTGSVVAGGHRHVAGRGRNRIPDLIYIDQAIYEREVERTSRGRAWNYVVLEAEIPMRRTSSAPMSDRHRSWPAGRRAYDRSFRESRQPSGSEFSRELRGNMQAFICPYRQWTYDLEGKQLRAAPVPAWCGRQGRHASGRHGVTCSAKGDAGKVSAENRKEMRAHRERMRLADPRRWISLMNSTARGPSP